MDNLEKFYRNHKEEFDHLEPLPGSWDKLDQQLRPEVKDEVEAKQFQLNHLLKIAAAVLLLLAAGMFMKEKNTLAFDPNIGLEENMLFPEIALTNPDGMKIPLSNLKGKVVLVEFWASHSTVCTEENCYYFKPIYKEFRDKGFEIYAISVDSSAFSWKQAIDRDTLEWLQVSDLKGSSSPIADQFDVTELPTTYLLDENGKIIAKNINADELKEKLNQLLALQ